MSTFAIKNTWLQANTADDELAATLARLQIFIDKKNITEYKATQRAPTETALQIPTYYFAEWIAENWWVLLYEPRKDEDSDDSEYVARHSIVAAQHGFPLPDLSMVPFGRSFRLNCARRRAPFSNIDFTTSAFADAPRDEVEKVLSDFIDDTVKRLKDRGLEEAALTQTWSEHKSLAPEERMFCEFVGSLGMSPSDISDEFARAMERVYEALGGRAMRDFCFAATKDAVRASITKVEAVEKYLSDAPEKPLPFAKMTLPNDNYYAPSWRRGMQAARSVREKFSVDAKDSLGADKLFDRLQIDPNQRAFLGNDDDSPSLPFSGAVDRRGDAAKIALLQSEVLQRRFSAGRAAYLGWVSEPESRRLVTNAVTRDQQASRSFAAEILIPQSYLKGLAGSKMELHNDQVREAARGRRVMPDVAFKQAYNAGIRVAEM